MLVFKQRHIRIMGRRASIKHSEVLKFAELVNAGHSRAAAARLLDRDRSSLKAAAKRFDVPIPKANWGNDVRRRFIERHQEFLERGLSQRQVYNKIYLHHTIARDPKQKGFTTT